MRVEFNQGVPRECVHWLWDNIGTGNLSREGLPGEIVERTGPLESHAWFYERVEKLSEPIGLTREIYYVPTITVKDEKLAIWFKLRWS